MAVFAKEKGSYNLHVTIHGKLICISVRAGKPARTQGQFFGWTSDYYDHMCMLIFNLCSHSSHTYEHIMMKALTAYHDTFKGLRVSRDILLGVESIDFNA
jgi:hypothetical protein